MVSRRIWSLPESAFALVPSNVRRQLTRSGLWSRRQLSLNCVVGKNTTTLRGSLYTLLLCHELYPLLYHEHGTHRFKLVTAPLEGLLLMIILASTQMVYMIIKVKEGHLGGARQDQMVL